MPLLHALEFDYHFPKKGRAVRPCYCRGFIRRSISIITIIDTGRQALNASTAFAEITVADFEAHLRLSVANAAPAGDRHFAILMLARRPTFAPAKFPLAFFCWRRIEESAQQRSFRLAPKRKCDADAGRSLVTFYGIFGMCIAPRVAIALFHGDAPLPAEKLDDDAFAIRLALHDSILATSSGHIAANIFRLRFGDCSRHHGELIINHIRGHRAGASNWLASSQHADGKTKRTCFAGHRLDGSMMPDSRHQNDFAQPSGAGEYRRCR